jgi:sialate O-acetylesterase
VPDGSGLTPYVKRGWQPCTAETAGYFSAVSYYFGAAIQEKLNVPVGLVSCPVGGTGIEPWISIPALRTVAGYENASVYVHRNGPGALFNGMIAPLTPMKIRGVLWYQGESSVGLGSRYGTLLKTLIGDWRSQFFDAAEMPFYIVQITPFGHDRKGRSAELREAQASALQLKNTGLAVTNDIGEPDNIHPKNKRDVGRRLAWQALNKTYGLKDIPPDGPTFQALAAAGDKLRITFRDTGAGLTSRDGNPLTCFEIAGADGNFVSAVAKIDGNDVIVSAPGIAEPKRVRFAWGDGDVPNLMARDGLPAAQFRAAVK